MGEVISLETRRERFRIVISPGLWRGFDVTVDPPLSTHPLRHAKTYNEAVSFALAIQRAEGWPMFSNCGGDEPTGGRAA